MEILVQLLFDKRTYRLIIVALLGIPYELRCVTEWLIYYSTTLLCR